MKLLQFGSTENSYASGKRYKMTALPLEFIFGWLMSLTYQE